MSDAVALFSGHTVHERRAPFLHRFRYAINSILIDLDQLDNADRQSALFSCERFNLFSFYSRDHGRRDGSSLKDWVRACLGDASITDSVGRVRLLCSPRVCGYVFNPLSVYFVDNAKGDLSAIIYQVHNTFGESHAYVTPCSNQTRETHSADKQFHVSPFFGVNGRYQFTIRPPSQRFKLTILKTQDDGPDLLATMTMSKRRLDTRALVLVFARHPFSTLKTILAIHWEALKLWIKGARYHSKPELGRPVTVAKSVSLRHDSSGAHAKTP